MKTPKKLTYQDALRAKPDGRSTEETYDAVVESIRKKYNHNITDAEAHEAARNLIGFCKTMLNQTLGKGWEKKPRNT